MKELFFSMYAASSLNLGDEILAVSGQPLNGLTHKEAVAKLKGAGSTVILRVRPNQTLGGEFLYIVIMIHLLCMLKFSTLDVFSSEIESGSADVKCAPKPHPPLLPTEREHEVEPIGEQEVPHPPKTVHSVSKAKGPLPPGWGEKFDLKTGRPYYEK